MEREQQIPASVIQNVLSQSIDEKIILPRYEVPLDRFATCVLQAEIQFNAKLPIDPATDAAAIKRNIKKIRENGHTPTGNERAMEYAKIFFDLSEPNIIMNPKRGDGYDPVTVNYAGLQDQFEIALLNPDGKISLTQIRPVNGFTFMEIKKRYSDLKPIAQNSLMLAALLFELNNEDLPSIGRCTRLYIREDTEHIQSSNSAFETIDLVWNPTFRDISVKMLAEWDRLRDGELTIPTEQENDEICKKHCVYVSQCKPELLSKKKKKKVDERNGNGAKQKTFENIFDHSIPLGHEVEGKCSDCHKKVRIKFVVSDNQEGVPLGVVRLEKQFDCGCSHILEVDETQLTH